MLNNLREPLELSAPLARRIARESCRKDPATGESCAGVHGFWQYLRLMGLAAAPGDQAEFFGRAFRSVVGASGAPRVLVSGAADYSMLAHVLASFRERELEPAVTVVDACDTPLFFNRWYAERESAKVECTRCDILEYASATPFDAVCSHSFLVQFSPEQRIRLLAKWRELLRPGGKVITVTRLRSAAGEERAGFSTEQAQAFRDTVLRKAESMRELLQVDPAEMAREAEIYMRGQRPWPVRSREEIQKLFEEGGFQVDELSDAPQAGTGERTPDGPAVAGSGERVQIIATRL
jgi:SAM-dependent methyltransferase